MPETVFGRGRHAVSLTTGYGWGHEFFGSERDALDVQTIPVLPRWSMGVTDVVGGGTVFAGVLDVAIEGLFLVNRQPRDGSGAGGATALRYNFPRGSWLVPYLGGGAGILSLDYDLRTHSDGLNFALFGEAGRVLLHPRCVNCHPRGDSPHQGMELALHDPPVVRGPDDRGVVGMECVGCHQDRNQPLTRVPGAPKWQLAPRKMAWVGRTPGQLCRQLKDPASNGGKTLAEIADHSAHDPLVGWGWSPGADREPAPGNQRQFGELIAAWIDTGAECPAEAAP